MPRLSPEIQRAIGGGGQPSTRREKASAKKSLGLGSDGGRREVVTLKRLRPDFSGWQEHEKGLPFKNGRFNVVVEVFDGRGKPTGKTEVAASFAAPELADICRDRINTQGPKFEARVVEDKRSATETDVDGIFSRDWAGQVEMQTSPWMVSASYLDEFGRWCGGGIVAFFDSQESAKKCADEINRLNPAHEATVDLYDE